ncbi:hypothetical protein GHT06_010276 [Daphnia sinensis]|uniref:Uncharacterized protein n=1 Tax=Daphnia sinensis TaxID=1820382 RepID=A0AAD5KY58_9CRUS|nr:hypothetical protein GHT06_010276 [Daphnia sinensis]
MLLGYCYVQAIAEYVPLTKATVFESVHLDSECVGSILFNLVKKRKTTALLTILRHNPDYTSNFTIVEQCSLCVTKSSSNIYQL